MEPSFEIGVISDTHGRLRAEAILALEGCDVIFHAGDVCGPLIVPQLAELAPCHAVAAEAPPTKSAATPSRFVDVPVEDSGNLEDSLPPLDVESAENEAANSDRRADFVFPESALASLPVAEVGKTAFPGDKEFIEAVESLPPGLKDKLKSTIGADFTALRPIPAGKLRRPL